MIMPILLEDRNRPDVPRQQRYFRDVVKQQEQDDQTVEEEQAAELLLQLDFRLDFLDDKVVSESRPVQERTLGLLATLLVAEPTDWALSSTTRTTTTTTTNATTRIQRQRQLQRRIWTSCELILQEMAKDSQYSVSPIPITALAKALRTMYQNNQLVRQQQQQQEGEKEQEHLGAVEIVKLLQLVASMPPPETQNEKYQGWQRCRLVGWNLYLSSLCDMAEIMGNPNDPGLAYAVSLLLRDQSSISSMSLSNMSDVVILDVTSYNLVMHVAATVGNATMVNDLWHDLVQKRQQQQRQQREDDNAHSWKNDNCTVLNLEPDSRTYNARLLATKDPSRLLEILDREILPRHRTTEQRDYQNSPIDTFVMDNLLIPLAQAGRQEDMFRLLDSVVRMEKKRLHHLQPPPTKGRRGPRPSHLKRNNHPQALERAFSAFFITLIQRGRDLKTARAIFDRYIMFPQQASSGATSTEDLAVPPDRRHFNILLEGYARILDEIAPIRKNDGDEEDLSVEDMEEAVANMERREKVIDAGREFRQLMKTFPGVASDAYTWTTLTKLCQTGEEVQELVEEALEIFQRKDKIPPAVIRAAITACGVVGDPAKACLIFDRFVQSDDGQPLKITNTRACNVLLGGLAEGDKQGNLKLRLQDTVDQEKNSDLLSILNGMTCSQAAIPILNAMRERNLQTFVVAATALQYETSSSPTPVAQPLARQLFQNATQEIGISVDGRLLNAILRCWGDDVVGALDHWKGDLRRSLQVQREDGFVGGGKHNLLAAYNGLLYVCGRARRPDVAVRIVYAMKKGGVDVNERAFQNYNSGKRMCQRLMVSGTKQKADKVDDSASTTTTGSSVLSNLRLPKLKEYMVAQYESILYVECKTFDARDKRTEKEQRIRIIV